ncbi:MAG: DUF1573 domain-containing protein [Flavobacteriales bacterium]
MSNGLKVGLLVVIAGALGFLGYSQWKKGNDEIESRPIPVAEQVQADVTGNANGGQPKKDGDVGAASQTRAKTSITYDKREHDFGKIKQGDQVECAFKVTNTGNEPLIIENAKGSCGCTVPEYPKDPIPPGESRDIKVKFNSAGKSNANTKTVTITANTDPIESVLTIKAFVEVPAGAEKDKKASGGH